MKPGTFILILIVLLVPVIAFAVVKKNDAKTPTTETNPTNQPSPVAQKGNQMVTKASDLVDPADAVTAKKVILKTSKGDITIDLYQQDAPKTVQNFVTLGKRGYYNGVIFHRVIKDFMVQGGDPTGTGAGGESIYGRTFPDEINSRKIVKASVAMANAGPNTNGSQFFMVTESDQPSLDGHYTNFGQVENASMKVVQDIAAVPTDVNDRPVDEVKITGFEIVE